jgi:uncharacterized protein HemY
MRWLWIFFAAVVGALVGSRLLQDPGYVLVRAGSWVVESSIAAGVIALLGVALTVYLLGVGWRYVATSLGLYDRWRSARQHVKSSDLWQRAVTDVVAGNWSSAAGLLATAVTPADRQLEVLLVRARALCQREDNQELAALLVKTRTDFPELVNELIFAIARWQLSEGDARSALVHLSQVAESDRASRVWSGLYAWGCVELMQWESLQGHWLSVEKNGVLKDDAFRAQMPLLRAGKAMADSVVADEADSQVSWRTGLKRLPKKWRSDSNTLALWAGLLMNSGREFVAFELLDHSLTKDWQPALLRQFRRFSQPKILGIAIQKADTWLKKRADDAELLLALGSLMNTNNQQAQARKHLLKAVQVLGLSVNGSQNAQGLEGRILTELGRSMIASEQENPQ